MRPADQISGKGDCGTDLAAYVLGALEPEEAQALQKHLTTCAVCRDEVAALQSVTEVLLLAAPQLAPPTSLKRRVMAEVRAQTRAPRSGVRVAGRASR